MTEDDSSVTGRLREATGALRGRPWLWVVGATWAAVALAGVFLVAAAWHVAGGLVFDLFVEPGGSRYRFPYGLSTVRHALARVGLTLALVLPVGLFLRATVLAPGAALADRTVRGDTFGGAARGVVADWPGLAWAGFRRGLRRLAVGLPLVLLAVAVYLSVGTALEAVGYALGLYDAVPWVLTAAALAAASLVGWAGAAATLQEYDASGRTGAGGLRTAFVVTVAHPRRRLVDTLLTTWLIALPFAVAAGLAALSVSANVERTTALWGAVPLFALFATVTLSVAVSYRSLSVAGGDPERRHGAGRSSDRRPDRSDASAPVGRVLLAVALVVSAGLVGAGVRFVDARPGTAAASPGPVPEDPDRAIAQSVAVLSETGWTADERWYDRRVYPGNDTTEPWRQIATNRFAVDRQDRQRLVFGVANGSEDPTGPGTLVYVSQTGVRVGSAPARVDGPDLNRTVRETFAETIAATSLTTELPDPGVYDGPVEVGSGWRVIDQSGGRVVYESTDAETVLAVSELTAGSVAAKETEPARVRVTLEAATGQLRRIEIVERYRDPDTPGVSENRFVRRYHGVGSTDVTVPATLGRSPGAVLLDALLY